MRRAIALMVPLLAACQPDASMADKSADRAATADARGQSAPPPQPPAPDPVEPAQGAARGEGTDDAQPRSCAAQIGEAEAARLVRHCINVSPATRPPCNAANSCALIRDEIARGCRFLDPGQARDAGCRALDDPRAAADIVRRYYEALSARQYRDARSLWRDDGAASGQSPAEFARGYADTRSVAVMTGTPGRIEGAAGSNYVTVPVVVRATLSDGRRQRFTGDYRLRRTAPVPGTTVNDTAWRIDSATLSADGN